MNDSFDKETEYFYDLTPDKILDAVEATGVRSTGYCLQLNSMENRVCEVGIEVEDDSLPRRDPSRFRIVKFYRPGRWNEKQILEEHEFLLDLAGRDIPVVTPIPFPDGKTLRTVPGTHVFYSLFKKIPGRIPDELNDEQLERIGRLLAQVHIVGASKDAPHRISLTPQTYGIERLELLKELEVLPEEIASRYERTVRDICGLSEKLFRGVKTQRIHGDCHLGNILWSADGPFLVDFDDMVRGPCVQDLWLVIPGRDPESKMQLEILVSAYEEMIKFDRTTISLIEPLRALRFIQFSSWIAKRWEDPAFKRAFPHFGSEDYWRAQLADLEEQKAIIETIR